MFKKFDIVKGVRGAPYAITDYNMKYGIVISDQDKYGYMSIIVIEHVNSIYIGCMYEVDHDYFEKVDINNVPVLISNRYKNVVYNMNKMCKLFMDIISISKAFKDIYNYKAKNFSINMSNEFRNNLISGEIKLNKKYEISDGYVILYN